MIPIRHTLERHGTPFVNRALVGANVAVFIVQVLIGPRAQGLMRAYGFVPARLIHPEAFGYTLLEAAVTLLTSLFLHGGLVHLAGNMTYLWVFGSSVEEDLGHFRYFVFFICAGAIGSLLQTALFPRSIIPSIGASGSIAGVLGVFLILHPRAHIVTLFPLVVYWAMAEIPALYLLPVWFLMQFLNGFLALSAARGMQEVAGIAWWAHVGGFLFGVIVGLASRQWAAGSRQ
jgi:membrane associated rhomboid family serine protease